MIKTVAHLVANRLREKESARFNLGMNPTKGTLANVLRYRFHSAVSAQTWSTSGLVIVYEQQLKAVLFSCVLFVNVNSQNESASGSFRQLLLAIIRLKVIVASTQLIV